MGGLFEVLGPLGGELQEPTYAWGCSSASGEKGRGPEPGGSRTAPPSLTPAASPSPTPDSPKQLLSGASFLLGLCFSALGDPLIFSIAKVSGETQQGLKSPKVTS